MVTWGEPYDRVRWRGFTWDYRTKAAVMELESRVGKTVMIYQGSYNKGVGASSGTHDGGGAIDCWVSGKDPNVVTRIGRNIGWAIWWRTAIPGTWPDHQHGILRRHDTASDDAEEQVSGPNGYDNGGDGLANTVGDDQPYRPNPPVSFRYGAWLKERELATQIQRTSRKINEKKRDLRHLVSIKRRLVARKKKLS